MAAPPRSPATRERRPRGEDTDTATSLLPLWRGIAVFRAVALVYAAINVVRFFEDYTHPGVAVGLLVGMTLWTAYTSLSYLFGTCTRGLGLADLAVTVAASLATLLVEAPERIAAGAPVITSAWAVGPVLAIAVLGGTRSGLAAALVSSAAVLVVRGRFDAGVLSSVQLLVVVGLAVGLAANTMRRSAARLQEAVAAEAATAERERLARGIHDGVLQVLAYVRRVDGDLGLDGPEIARLAAEQETSLRRLLSSGPPHRDAGGDPGPDLDLVAELAAVLPARAQLALPPGPVVAPAATVAALVAAAREAASNADEHAGPGAGLWVLVEDEREAITVTVRDDGPGIADGRLVEAAAGGHLGVASSIRERLRELGGSAELVTGPGAGTEWELRVAR